ncbi:MAG: hydantoinase B/oxoprolinase family protein [Rhodospirillaceae bacterium]|jgi:N-methylhydantoinase B|nr:hydantoinase B/oxoprolinase family protein [Rhodospirillaceae bacterium]MBT3492371.1 hydantoinase B/oxoprolinase family protein [Rhodospirillaceae bacterium]MBT3780025.1 hydantoinase B/oxoprolinase family protein [Rhodospirillaceae bacterium]MBT3978691.1 hydantoinase B/oxoprolinase family protein [Rhodospirillaceae bacterium]MBT4168463.1 hydantoinase B/oxoprolinase family protein [Rhodospirillaceae bacterium]
MTRTHDDIDPITLEILRNSLRSITDESYIALTKAAYSTNIKERRDHSIALTDTQGRLVVQSENSLPIHLASMLGMMEQLLDKYAEQDFAEGDIFVANDPYVAGGTHLPDVNLAMPAFVDGKLLGFVCNIAHHADIGGMTPGSMAGGMSEIYQEGLRIPLVRLFKAGELVQDIFDLLLLNVRVPHERRGDYFAQVAACRLGSRRLGEMAQRYGRAMLAQSFDAIMDRTEARLRDSIRTVPDGVYEFTDLLDNDGMGTSDIPISVRVDVAGENIAFDFTGTGPQMKGNFNMTFNAAQSAVYYVLKAMLDPDLPNNHGLIRAVEISAPLGTLVNAVHPAAVAGRANTSQRVVDVLIGALAQALPEQAVGAANGANVTAVFFGHDPRHDRTYLYLETLGGGFGGRFTKDGKDGVQVHITNTSNLPVEAIEAEYPLMVESYGLIPDSGGAGKYRGGMGIRRVVRPIGHEAVFSGMGERFAHQPWGIFGGQPGGTGRFSIQGPSHNDETLPDKPNHVPFGPDDTVVIETPGAGGYGDPAERDAEAVAADYRDEKFSAEYLRKYYGFEPPE